MNNKVGRNDPCPCGSGKKYKSCCLNKAPESKKVYSPSGKRKFKARVIDSALGTQEIFSKAGGGVPKAGGNPEVLEKLKFRMTDHDYRAGESKVESSEKESVPEEAPKKKEIHFLPGTDFKMATDDFRVEEK